jgi:hypothetical protein
LLAKPFCSFYLKLSGALRVAWEPIETAPMNRRVLVCDDNGKMFVARSSTLRWRDEADRLVNRPKWWQSLPQPPRKTGSSDELVSTEKERPKPKLRGRRRERRERDPAARVAGLFVQG